MYREKLLKKRSLFLAFICVFFLLASWNFFTRSATFCVSAEVPPLISIQGRLTDASGVNKPDGLYTLKFCIYDNVSGGNLKWGPETHINVTIKNGIFQVFLGEVIGGIKSTFDESNRWLEITVVKDGLEETLIPRQKLVSVGYAFKSEDADKLDGKDSTDFLDTSANAQTKSGSLSLSGNLTVEGKISGDGSVPRGIIVMWSGSINSIPSGWALCDGTNGTPDLRDRFILGISAQENPGGMGGAHSYTLTVSQLPSHTHMFTTDEAGEHYHGLYMREDGVFGGGSNRMRYTSNDFGYVTREAGNHMHTGTTDSTGGNGVIDNRPAFYKLAFIFKL